MPESVLTVEMLERFRGRAGKYDRENSFFHEDFEELRESGYLKLCLPEEFGGTHATLAEVAEEQRKLAAYAPATALATNMHFYWTGLAADLMRAGDDTCRWMLEAAGNGDVFAAGHGERGNDMPILLSSSSAEKVDGGYKFTGHKSFGSLSPVWDWLGLHGMDTSDPAAPKVVHAFMKRDTENYHINEVWDALGMRATKSEDTILEGVVIPDEYVSYVVPAGFAGANLFVLGIFAWADVTFAHIYCGLARRAVELTRENLTSRKSIAIGSGEYRYHPELQHGFAEMVMAVQGIEALIEKLAADWSAQVPDAANWAPETAGGFAARIVGAKYMATEAAFKVVDQAVDICGGFGVARGGELERLFRDARMGRLHPATSPVAHEVVAKIHLGIDPDIQPRWG
jgi:alkylation response protein AidB-like acyl-CoA dehydrogenase